MNVIKCNIPSSIVAISAYAEAISPDYTWTEAEADCKEYHPELLQDFKNHKAIVEDAEQIVEKILETNMPFPLYTSIELGDRKHSITAITYRWRDPYLLCIFHFTQF